MKVLEAVQTIASLGVSVGVGAIISNVIKATTPSGIKVLTKICIGIGSFVVGSMLSDMAGNYTEKKIGDAIEFVTRIVMDEPKAE